jgi:two-component system NarL family response regulator
MNRQIKIMIVDDHPIVRTGLAAVINTEPDLAVVAEASNGREAVEMFPRYLPDITLIDLRLPEMDGTETIAAIRRQFPASKFVVLTTFDHDTDIHRASEAGASGYLLKGMFNNEFIKAIRAVLTGLRYFPPKVAERLGAHHFQVELTPREQEILTLLVQGKSNKEIADQLAIAESTVRWFLTIIYGKLEVRDRTQAVTAALRKGLVKLGNE